MNGPSIRQLDTPAQLQTATDVTTAQGGRTRSWTTLTTLWLQFQPAAGMEISEPGLPPRRREAATAIARDNPALYRLMYDCSRNMESLPPEMHEKEHSAYAIVRNAMIEAGRASADNDIDVELATVAAWCVAHGIAEMGGFAQFAPLKQALGGELNFYRELLLRSGNFQPR